MKPGIVPILMLSRRQTLTLKNMDSLEDAGRQQLADNTQQPNKWRERNKRKESRTLCIIEIQAWKRRGPCAWIIIGGLWPGGLWRTLASCYLTRQTQTSTHFPPFPLTLTRIFDLIPMSDTEGTTKSGYRLEYASSNRSKCKGTPNNKNISWESRVVAFLARSSAFSLSLRFSLLSPC